MSNFEDLTGKKYNMLTVVERAENSKSGRARWRCLCDCGNYTVVTSSNLKNGSVKSCGCKTRLDDLTGKQFGKLKVIKRGENKYDGRGKPIVMWECICDCGNKIFVSSESLKSGNTRSCGCIKNPDLTGKRFGKLIVIKSAGVKNKRRTWECKCDCGNITFQPTYALIGGYIDSCGCTYKDIKFNKVDLTGFKIGHLTVLEKTRETGKNNEYLYKCKCDCGNEILIRTSQLRYGEKLSCGCKYGERIKNALDKLKKEEFVEGTYLLNLNTKKRIDNKSGRKGVIWEKRRERWMAYITFQGHRKHLGYYDNFESAVEAREKAEKEYFEPILNRYGRKLE